MDINGFRYVYIYMRCGGWEQGYALRPTDFDTLCLARCCRERRRCGMLVGKGNTVSREESTEKHTMVTKGGMPSFGAHKSILLSY